jgi:hypothetical protein
MKPLAVASLSPRADMDEDARAGISSFRQCTRPVSEQ